MSYILPAYDDTIKSMRVLRNILITSVSFDTNGTAVVTIATGLTNLQVFVESKTSLRTYSYSYNSTNGNVTIYGGIITRSLTTATAVTGVTVTTRTVVTGITQTTGVVVTGVTISTASVVNSVTVATGSFVNSVGDDIGRWNVTGTTGLYHTHAVTTAVAVTGVTPATTSVVSGVTASTSVGVLGMTVSTGTAVSGVTITTGSLLSDVSVTIVPATGESVNVIVMW